MAKEMKQNFGSHRSKSVTKPGSAMGSGGSSWGMSAIPPITNAIGQQGLHSVAATAQDQNNSIVSPAEEDNNDSNNSSIQSNSNSEFSEINDHPHPTVCQVATLRQRSANTPTPKRNYQVTDYKRLLVNQDSVVGSVIQASGMVVFEDVFRTVAW